MNVNYVKKLLKRVPSYFRNDYYIKPVGDGIPNNIDE